MAKLAPITILTLHGNRKINSGTRIRCQEFLADRRAEHTAENSELLMYRGGFDRSHLLGTELGFDPDALSKTFPKVKIDRIRGDVQEQREDDQSLRK